MDSHFVEFPHGFKTIKWLAKKTSEFPNWQPSCGSVRIIDHTNHPDSEFHVNVKTQQKSWFVSPNYYKTTRARGRRGEALKATDCGEFLNQVIHIQESIHGLTRHCRHLPERELVLQVTQQVIKHKVKLEVRDFFVPFCIVHNSL